MEHRRKLLAAGALALAVVSFQHPSADIRVLTHRTGDLSPARFEAAVDLGFVALSVLVTWTADRLARP